MNYHLEEKKVLQVARALQATRPRGCAIVDVIVYTIFYNTPSNGAKYCGVYSGGLCQAMVNNVCVCVCVFVCVCTSELPSNWQERKRLREEEQLKQVAGQGKDGEPSSPKPCR